MNIAIIEKLAHDWRSMNWKVIELERVNLKSLQKLFRDTYDIIGKLSTEKLVPKEMCGLLLEMYEFSWWVTDLKDTPIHYLYQEIVSLVNELNKYFLTRDADTEEIKYIINEKLINN